MIQFILNLRPKPQARHRNNGKFQYDPSSADKKTFSILAKEYAPPKPYTHNFDLHITFCYKRPKSHFRSKNKTPILKKDVPFYKKSKPDIDNLVKFYMDAMNGLFYVDDAQVVSVNAQKVYGSENYVHVKLFHNNKYC